MELKDIYIFAEEEIKKGFGTKSNMARSSGITRQEVSKVMANLKSNGGITYKKVEEFLNNLGYELAIKKRG